MHATLTTMHIYRLSSDALKSSASFCLMTGTFGSANDETAARPAAATRQADDFVVADIPATSLQSANCNQLR
jgi:hypothetical protein